MKRGSADAPNEGREAALEALEALLDDRTDTSEIPESIDWSDARRGLLHRPVKKQITLRLDTDVVTWFRRRVPGGGGYQTEIHSALREYVPERNRSTDGTA